MTLTQTPQWLKSRALGFRSASKSFPAGSSSLICLGLEKTLTGHSSCVNCLEYNQSGNLLLSGSDDKSVIIWETFKSSKRNQIRTSHTGNIFSAKFISNTSDTQIATCASDAKVKVVDILKETTILNCDSCHIDRIKRLAVHPSQVDLLWSSGEDGLVNQYDLREKHLCKPKKSLIDLNSPSTNVAAKCISINPTRDEQLAVGGSNALVYLYDRRCIRSQPTTEKAREASCPRVYTPGHLTTGSGAHRTAGQVCGVTYVAFNPAGTELLANLRSEQIYLFDLQSSVTNQQNFQVLGLERACANLLTGKVTTPPVCRLTGEASEFYAKAFVKLDNQDAGMSKKLTVKDLNKINQLLSQYKHHFQLHQLKAAALVDRNWRGDCYESMRESIKSLELNPFDSKSWLNLSYTASQCGNEELVLKLLNLIRTVQEKYLIVTQDINQAPCLTSCDISEISFAVNLLLQAIGIGSKPPSPIEELTFAAASYDLLEDVGSQSFNGINDVIYNRQKRSYTPKNCPDDKLVVDEANLQEALDFSRRYCGHCNINTDIKEANFYGPQSEFIVAGSDDGALYIWDKQTTNLLKAIQADMNIVNCVQVHPSISMLATSGIEPNVKIWSPSSKVYKDVQALESRCNQNEQFVSADPLDAMMMMFYPNFIRSHIY